MLRQLQQGFGKQSTVNSAQANHHLSAREQEASSSSVPPLTDADYEFLFSQLLEGVAHGWHSPRIAKFFQQLGDRGQPQQWVAWLERFSTKILTFSHPHEQQLGARMMRLGQLTESTPSVQQIGVTAYHIGRQLFYGNTLDLVWEYEGPDLEIAAEAISETEALSDYALSEAQTATNFSSTETVSESFLEKDTEDTFIQTDEIATNQIIIQFSSTETARDSLREEEKGDSLLQTDEIAPNQLSIKFFSPQTVSESFPEEKEDTSGQQEITTQQATSHFSHSAITTQFLLKEKEKKLSQNQSPATHQLVFSDPSVSHSKLQTTDLPATEIKEEIELNNLELVEGWFNLGLKQASSGNFEGAIESWERVLKLNPHICEAWHNRGSALGRIEQYEEAIESFDRALAINPKNYQAWNDRAHALYQLKKWSEAIASWDKAIEIIPGDCQFWYKRGCALEKLQRFDESVASYEKALEIKPDFQQARSRYIKLLADKSQ
ncbi:tetratricopeptide repeat protein [Pleurocapsales cyanobacterium LEGE 06147]|nr:tetratricopeptide repeat protein [Pleurocapsales cyanobacterium LEGE 06147]